MKAQPGWSSGWRPVTGASDAGEHALVALELVHAQQADVRRYQDADAERDHVTGHEGGHGDPALFSVPAHLGLLSDLGPERGHGHLRPVLVDEAQSDAQGDDHGDDHGVGATSGQSRDQRGDDQQYQDGVAELAEEDGGGVHPVRAQRVGPEPPEPFGGLV